MPLPAWVGIHCIHWFQLIRGLRMDFSIPKGLEKTVSEVEHFVDEELIPLEPDFLVDGLSSVDEQFVSKRKKARDEGLWLPHLDEKWGGMGLSLLGLGLVAEQLGRCPFGHYIMNCQPPDAGNMELLIAHGSDEQQKMYLEPLLEGKIRSCFSMTEPGRAGSNPTWLETTAVRDGDEYVINGRKWFTSSASGSEFAIVMAVTNPEADSPYERASQIIVPTDHPGFQIVRNISVMGDRGSDYMSHAEVEYDDCRVPVSNLIGAEGKGFVLAQQRLGPGRIHHCMRWIGICERAFELMCQRANERQIKPGTRLGEAQMIQEKIADSRAEIDAARLMTLKAAWRIDREGFRAARADISAIKYFVAGVLQDVLDRAIQVHGALGMTDDTPLAWWYRHERAARIYDGPDEVHKRVVARSELES